MACNHCSPRLLFFRFFLFLVGGGACILFLSPALVGVAGERDLYFRTLKRGGASVVAGMYTQKQRNFYQKKSRKLVAPWLRYYETDHSTAPVKKLAFAAIGQQPYYISFTRGNEEFESQLLPETILGTDRNFIVANPSDGMPLDGKPLEGMPIASNFKIEDFVDQKGFQWEIFEETICFRIVPFPPEQKLSQIENGDKDEFFANADTQQLFIVGKWVNAQANSNVVTAVKMREFYYSIPKPPKWFYDNLTAKRQNTTKLGTKDPGNQHPVCTKFSPNLVPPNLVGYNSQGHPTTSFPNAAARPPVPNQQFPYQTRPFYSGVQRPPIASFPNTGGLPHPPPQVYYKYVGNTVYFCYVHPPMHFGVPWHMVRPRDTGT